MARRKARGERREAKKGEISFFRKRGGEDAEAREGEEAG